MVKIGAELPTLSQK